MDIDALILATGIPSAITGFCFWILEKKMQSREAMKEQERKTEWQKQDEKEQLREKQQFLLLQSVNAAIALGEATAKAVQRIPDAHCNGDMHKALEYAEEIKHEQKEFLTKQGIQNINE